MCLHLCFTATFTLNFGFVFYIKSLFIVLSVSTESTKEPGTDKNSRLFLYNVDNTALSHPARHNHWLCYLRLFAGDVVDL